MAKRKAKSKIKNSPSPSIWGLLGRYKGIIILLVFLTILANALSVAVPKIIAKAIDTFGKGNFSLEKLSIEFSIIAVLIFIFTYLQNIVQVLASERVARDMRNDIVAKISVQPFAYIEKATPAKLLTNLTSDVDAVKTFVSFAISSIVSSFFLFEQNCGGRRHNSSEQKKTYKILRIFLKIKLII